MQIRNNNSMVETYLVNKAQKQKLRLPLRKNFT